MNPGLFADWQSNVERRDFLRGGGGHFFAFQDAKPSLKVEPYLGCGDGAC